MTVAVWLRVATVLLLAVSVTPSFADTSSRPVFSMSEIQNGASDGVVDLYYSHSPWVSVIYTRQANKLILELAVARYVAGVGQRSEAGFVREVRWADHKKLGSRRGGV